MALAGLTLAGWRQDGRHAGRSRLPALPTCAAGWTPCRPAAAPRRRRCRGACRQAQISNRVATRFCAAHTSLPAAARKTACRVLLSLLTKACPSPWPCTCHACLQELQGEVALQRTRLEAVERLQVQQQQQGAAWAAAFPPKALAGDKPAQDTGDLRWGCTCCICACLEAAAHSPSCHAHPPLLTTCYCCCRWFHLPADDLPAAPPAAVIANPVWEPVPGAPAPAVGAAAAHQGSGANGGSSMPAVEAIMRRWVGRG